MHPEHSSAEASTPLRGPASWSLNLATGELTSSQARAWMLGYEPSSVEPTVAWWDQMLHPNERLAVYMARTRHLEGVDSGYRSEYRARRQNGEWIWLLEIGCIERDPKGIAQFVHGVVLDITVDHETQFRLQQRLERLSVISDYTHQFTGLLAPDGTLLEINRSAIRASEAASLNEVLGKPIWEASKHSREPTNAALLRDAVAKASRGESVRSRMHTESATTGKRIIDLSLSPVLDDSGRVTCILSEGRDVTDIVSTRQQLRTLGGSARGGSQHLHAGLVGPEYEHRRGLAQR
jgi:PAS domain S-box-containing protein